MGCKWQTLNSKKKKKEKLFYFLSYQRQNNPTLREHALGAEIVFLDIIF